MAKVEGSTCASSGPAASSTHRSRRRPGGRPGPFLLELTAVRTVGTAVYRTNVDRGATGVAIHTVFTDTPSINRQRYLPRRAPGGEPSPLSLVRYGLKATFSAAC